eukprot:gene10956-11942_t
MNSKSKLPSLSEYEERIFRKKDIACLFYLDFLIQLKVLNFQELKLVLKLLQRIYEKHLKDFRFLEFYSLGLVTKIVTLYEINDEIISGCSISFTDALTNGDVEFKMQAAVGYFEIIHLHYYLLNEEYIRSSFMYLNTIYKKENDEDTKDYILRVFKRMAELELIPADLRVDFYNEMYKELMSKKEKGSEEVIKILNFFHDQKLPIDHARPDELIDLLKLIALNTNGNKLQTSLQALYISRETANVFTYESFQKLLNKLINFRDEEYISQTLNLILRMLNSYPTDFYVSFEEETKLRTSSLLLNNINNYYLDSLDIVIANQRQRFLNMNEIPIEDEHPILSDARILMSLGASEQTTIPEKNYQYMAISDLLQGTKLNVSPGLIYFELNIPKLDSLIADGCNLYNEYLAHKLKQENYLDEGRNIHTKVENDEVNMLPEFPLNDNALRELLDEQLKTANEARKTRDSYLQGFVLKDAISLLFVLQKEKWKLHRKYKDILFPVKVNQDLRLAIRSLTQLALQLDQLFPIPTTTDVSSYKKAEELAVKLISRLEKNKTLIIPSGMPIKMNEKESKHFFYILIKNCGEKKYKLIIVNGGDNLENAVDADKSFVAADVNMPGNNWLCRETNEIDLNIIDQKRFTKEYIHRALLLPYTQINKADPHYQKKNLMDNINLISEKFLGFGFAPTVYKPEVVPVADRKYSMPSQLFGNCTVFNLQFALRFMFDWNEAQFTQFIHDSYLRYNNFLHRRVEKLSLTFKDSTNPGGADVFSSSEEANYTAQILTERNPQRRRAYSI